MSSIIQPCQILLATIYGLVNQRRLLAVKAHASGRKSLRELTTIVTPPQIWATY